MATPSAPAAPVKIIPATYTTRRGLATASFCFGFWGLCTFWWYPYGMMLASVGLSLGLITLTMGVRAGKDGENLGLLGVAYSSAAIGVAIGAYRFVQVAFEGTAPFGLFVPAWLGG